LMAPATKSIKQSPSVASLKDADRASRPPTPSNLSKDLPPTPSSEPVEKELPPTPQEQQEEVSVVIQKTENIHPSESNVSLQAPSERNGRSDSMSGSLSSGEESIRSSETDSLSLSRTS